MFSLYSPNIVSRNYFIGDAKRRVKNYGMIQKLCWDMQNKGHIVFVGSYRKKMLNRRGAYNIL
jgi:hypothetical protein